MGGANQRTGTLGETLAAQWLEEKGYSILHRNWRHSRYEIDLVASHRNILHFFEVKTRSSGSFGPPEESVHRKKLRHMIHASQHYMEAYPEWKRVQYNIISITLNANMPAEFFMLEDVYC